VTSASYYRVVKVRPSLVFIGVQSAAEADAGIASSATAARRARYIVTSVALIHPPPPLGGRRRNRS
jgi:hypothetical protein